MRELSITIHIRIASESLPLAVELLIFLDLSLTAPSLADSTLPGRELAWRIIRIGVSLDMMWK
jgi:hypothetical protein